MEPATTQFVITLVAALSALVAVIGYLVTNSVKTQISEIRDALREDLSELFNAICHERQEACGRLQDTKLIGQDSKYHAVCSKLDKLQAERREAWVSQRNWNEKIEALVYRPRGDDRRQSVRRKQ